MSLLVLALGLVAQGPQWSSPPPLVAWQVEAPAAPAVQNPPPPAPEAKILPPPIVEHLEGDNPPVVEGKAPTATTQHKLRELEAELRRQIDQYTKATRDLKPFVRPAPCTGCPESCESCACGCGRSGPQVVTPPEPVVPGKPAPMPVAPAVLTYQWYTVNEYPGWQAYGYVHHGRVLGIRQWRPVAGAVRATGRVLTAPFRVFGGGGCVGGVCR